MTLQFIAKTEFDRVRQGDLSRFDFLGLVAKMSRLNTLVEVKRAGSGHLGTSFSAMDIVTYLYYHHLNIKDLGPDSADRDIYFSSKGHDAPGLYAVLYSLGVVSEEKFLKLRRLGGLDGHPDIKIKGIEANTGSLGMGISKARGMSWAKKHLGRRGRVFVMTGDGEWQEGQNFEALQSTVQQKITNLTVIMDHNKLQSDRLVDRIVSLGDLEAKYRAFGWHVARCDGHDFKALEATLASFEKIADRPKILIADTIKGRGVSFMEHPNELKNNGGYYRWHSGAPDDENFKRAFAELHDSLTADFNRFGLGSLAFKEAAPEVAKVTIANSLAGEPLTAPPVKESMKATAEFVNAGWGEALVELAPKHPGFVVLDADLSFDCKLRKFEDTFPDRFIEVGIAEQDMVSQASGLALQGLLPVVNSFANFLAARANEQIANNMGENKKIIYACHYAGVIPAGPGKSHQSVRDISLFGAFSNCTIMQASSAAEMKLLAEYAITNSPESCMIRLNIGPSPRAIELPAGYSLKLGRGFRLHEGRENVMFAYGPVMLHEALLAAETLSMQGTSLKVINMPWLNRFDRDWIMQELAQAKSVFVLEDHSPVGGLGDGLIDFLTRNDLHRNLRIRKFGVEGIPACGTPAEALRFHGLDGASLAERMLRTMHG